MPKDKTIRMKTRIITFEWKLWCYNENIKGDQDKCNAYESPWNEVEVSETGYFSGMSLTRWRDYMEDNFDLLVQDQGEKDCQDIKHYLHLCKYEIKVTNVKSKVGERYVRE